MDPLKSHKMKLETQEIVRESMSPQLEITTEGNIEKKEDRDPSVTSVRDRDIMSTVVGTKILPNVPNLGEETYRQ